MVNGWALVKWKAMTRSCHNHRTGGEKVGSTTNYYSKVSNEHTYTGKMTYSQGQVSDKSLHERKSSKKIHIHLFVWVKSPQRMKKVRYFHKWARRIYQWLSNCNGCLLLSIFMVLWYSVCNITSNYFLAPITRIFTSTGPSLYAGQRLIKRSSLLP